MHVQLSERHPLAFGSSVKRPISKGETHEYSLTLDAGDFAKIVLRQQGIDLVLTLSKEGPNPDMIEVDGANGSAGQESVTLLGGNYLVKVQTRDRDAEPGNYEIFSKILNLESTESITQKSFFKIAKKISLSEWDDVHDFYTSNFREILKMLESEA